MFKKKPQIKPLAPLRSSDRRKLADQIIKEYGIELEDSSDGTPEDKAEATAVRTNLRNALLPDNTQSARFTTTHGPDLKKASGVVYVGGKPGTEPRILWFEIEKQIYPSVYTLWNNADIVPLLHTPRIVISKLQGGADLMTPGLAGRPPFPPKAKKDAVVAIASTDVPSVPLAVGRCEINVSSLGPVQGLKGKAVENMHWVGDELWNYSPNGKGGQEEPGELDGWNAALARQGMVGQMDDLSLEDDEAGGVDLDNIGAGTNGSAAGRTAPVEEDDSAGLREASDEVESRQFTTKEIDEAFRNAFLFGVHQHMSTHRSAKNFGLEFPLTQSFVMSTLVQPFLPAFTNEEANQLQIKKTSFKNIKKFIKSLDKEKIVKSKDKDGNETVIVDIDFDDAAIQSFKPYPLPRKETIAGSALGRGELGTSAIDTGDNAVGQKLEIKTFYKPTVKLQPIFDTASAASNESAAFAQRQLFTKAEIRPLVESYVAAEGLVSETNKRLVKLNPTLANSIFDGSGPLDKEVIAKGSVPRDTLVDRILDAMSRSYAILRNADPNEPAPPKTKSGAPPKIKITLETRSGNKTVTKVSGVEAYFVNPKPLADELRKVCAGSTSVEPLAGATKKNEKPIEEIMVQGPQRDAVIKALERRGVQARWVEVLDKTKGKGKGR